MTLLFSLLMTVFLVASIVVDRWSRTASNLLMLIALALLIGFLAAMIPAMGV